MTSDTMTHMTWNRVHRSTLHSFRPVALKLFSGMRWFRRSSFSVTLKDKGDTQLPIFHKYCTCLFFFPFYLSNQKTGPGHSPSPAFQGHEQILLSIHLRSGEYLPTHTQATFWNISSSTSSFQSSFIITLCVFWSKEGMKQCHLCQWVGVW